jgi:4-carboxymuconolactone decarboxylase
LSVEHRADDELYREAETLFGTNALMDIAVRVGTYHMACATLTTFATPAPG